MSEVEKFKSWLEEEKKKGLKGFHFSLSVEGETATLEEICEELNRIQAALQRGEGEVLVFNDSRRKGSSNG